MASNFHNYNFQLMNDRTKRPIDDDTGQFIVYTVDTPGKATVYSDSVGTSLTQPGTVTNGYASFWMDVATTSVDVTVLTSTGRSYFLKGVTPSQHVIYVNSEKLEYTLALGWAILSAHADGTVSALGFQLQTGMQIKDVVVQKTSAGVGVGAGLVVDFGVSGDPDGFIDGITATATGYYLNEGNFTNATGALGGMFVSGVQNRGVLITEFGTGLDTATTAGVRGFISRKSYLASLVTTTNNLVFAINGTSALTTAVGSKGYVFYIYDILPTAGN